MTSITTIEIPNAPNIIVFYHTASSSNLAVNPYSH
jgi:hypothetical protein